MKENKGFDHASESTRNGNTVGRIQSKDRI